MLHLFNPFTYFVHSNHPNVEAETENIPLYDHLDVVTEDTMVAKSSNPEM